MFYNQNIFIGASFIILAEFLYAGMGAAIKTISVSLPNEVIVFIRNLIGALLLLPFVKHHGFHSLKTKVPLLHLSRAIIGLSAMYCFFYALGRLPLAEGVLLKMTTPIFMPIFAFLLIKEQLSHWVILAVAIGFAGVWLVLNPDNNINDAALVGLLGGLLTGLAKVNVRKLGQTEPAMRIVFIFTIASTIISAIPMLWTWQLPSIQQMLLLMVIAITATLGQLCMTRGYGTAPASQVGPFTYTSVLFATAYGYIFWQEIPKSTFVLGAILIAIAGILALKSSQKKAGLENTIE